MLTVPLFVELLRTRPALLFWSAALTQGALWWLVPALFYSAPPGDLPQTLAIAREWQFGSFAGPPLAYWFAEVAFRAAGLTGVYLLSQACVVIAYWAVFTLGREIVGDRHAAIAALLMVGISAFTVPTPDFGPGVLAIPFWAMALLHYWRAAGQGRRVYWYWLGFDLGLLLLTTYAAVILILLLTVFPVASARGREQLLSIEPWIAGVLAVLIFFPHLIWIDQTGRLAFETASSIDENLRAWVRLLASLVVAHAGLAMLVLIAREWRGARTPAPAVERPPVDPAAQHFVQFFAIAPAVAIALLALFTRREEVFVAAPLVLLSTLAIVVMAGERIRIARPGFVSVAWGALLVAPPLVVALAVTLGPWAFGADYRMVKPASAIGRFFGESFERRIGRPLMVVTGDPRTAELVALGARSRPSVFYFAAPERSPSVGWRDIAEKGAIVVWPATDTRGAPPAAIRERFPNLVTEVPRGFARRWQGRLPLHRVGWAVIRPGTIAP